MARNIFQEHELVAYLGGEEMARDFDIDAIIDEVTEIDHNGNRCWRDLEPGELNDVAQRHLLDFYAVDNYDAETGKVHRLYVGDKETAKKMAADRAAGVGLVDYEGNPCEPGEFQGIGEKFYRATLIDRKSADDYIAALGIHVDGINELLPVSEAARIMDRHRQSVYGLVNRGSIASEVIGGEIRIGRYSVELWKRRNGLDS